MKIALVSTFAGCLPVMKTWLDYHRSIGVERFYLFVDKPEEFAGFRALDSDGVSWFNRDESLYREWPASPGWEYFSTYCHRQVYARQCLNADYAIRMGRAEGMDWILHLDLDEKLHVPPMYGDLKGYLATKSHYDVVRFVNHEGIPEQWHVGDYFNEVTLFKINAAVLTKDQLKLAQHAFGERYFLAYFNGKAAMNFHGKCTESAGVHEYKPVDRIHLEGDACVLHYTNCGFNWYYNKYSTLGDYEDHWLDIAKIGDLFPIMEQSRKAVVRGNIHEATEVYQRELMLQGGLPHSRASLLKAGILRRFGEAPPQLI